MIKQDLKTGMLVQTRDKEIYLILEQALIVSYNKNSFGWNKLDDYTDTLTMSGNQGSFDIMKVTRVLIGGELCSWTGEFIDKYLLWSREDGEIRAKTSEKPPRKEQFDIETSTWTETKKDS